MMCCHERQHLFRHVRLDLHAGELQSAELKVQLQLNYVARLTDVQLLAEEQLNLEALQFTVKKLKERIRTRGPIAVLKKDIEMDIFSTALRTMPS